LVQGSSHVASNSSIRAARWRPILEPVEDYLNLIIWLRAYSICPTGNLGCVVTLTPSKPVSFGHPAQHAIVATQRRPSL
jgi:hypothetical protein